VWVYAGGGQAELGIVPWLERHFPAVTFQRKTPQFKKPGPRPGVAVQKEVVGQTGRALGSEIRSQLKRYWSAGPADLILVLDDTDCDLPEARANAHRLAVTESIPPDANPYVVIALAVQELEVWLLADWSQTFVLHHKRCYRELKNTLVQQGVDFNHPEQFDCKCGTQEYRKISEVLRDAFNHHCGERLRYSKDTDTRRLLMAARPEAISERCPHFKAFWNELKIYLATTP
jgi:hypothetical protein